MPAACPGLSRSPVRFTATVCRLSNMAVKGKGTVRYDDMQRNATQTDIFATEYKSIFFDLPISHFLFFKEKVLNLGANRMVYGQMKLLNFKGFAFFYNYCVIADFCELSAVPACKGDRIHSQ